MDSFARRSNDDRKLFFEQAAAQRGVTAQIIEKDFWVCWGLRRLFSLAEFANHLTFKGGTSLSKVYGAISRFSEDIDIAIERDFLGFGGSNSPEAATGKEQRRRIDALQKTCQQMIAGRLMPALKEAIATTLGTVAGWQLLPDPSDPDCQALEFQYPAAITTGLSHYFAPSVKFEFGARSDHFPCDTGSISSYVSQELPNLLPDGQVLLRTLSAARTFWEKATILHMIYHQPRDKTMAPRMSRHYYDLYCLSQSAILNQALGSIDLLVRVAEFKQVYFKAAWAKYEEARPGTLRLVPDPEKAAKLAEDFRQMGPMFFREPPSFRDIIASISTLEERINSVH